MGYVMIILWLAGCSGTISEPEIAVESALEAPIESPTESSAELPTEPPTEPEIAAVEACIEPLPREYLRSIEWAFNINDLIGNNPWLYKTEAIEALPVFANPARGRTIEDMTELVRNTAHALNWPIDEITIEEWGETIGVVAHFGERQIITSNASMGLAVSFGMFDLMVMCQDIEGAQAIVEQYLQRYAHVFNMQNPTLSITFPHFLMDDIPVAQINHAAFDAGNGGIIDAILAYNFHRVVFGFSLNRDLLHMSWNLPELTPSQPLGVYPIITAGEARELLIQGHRDSSFPDTFWPGDEFAKIAHVELVYRANPWYDIVRPYYLFRIEIPEHMHGREITEIITAFGRWWVPAIR
jgi:hypothetical protein